MVNYYISSFPVVDCKVFSDYFGGIIVKKPNVLFGPCYCLNIEAINLYENMFTMQNEIFSLQSNGEKQPFLALANLRLIIEYEWMR